MWSEGCESGGRAWLRRFLRRVEGEFGLERERKGFVFLVEADEGRGVFDEVATVFAPGADDALPTKARGEGTRNDHQLSTAPPVFPQ